MDQRVNISPTGVKVKQEPNLAGGELTGGTVVKREPIEDVRGAEFLQSVDDRNWPSHDHPPDRTAYQVKQETEHQPGTETRSEYQPKPGTEPGTETRTECQPELRTEPRTEHRLRQETEHQPGTETRTEYQPEPETEHETGNEPETEHETDLSTPGPCALFPAPTSDKDNGYILPEDMVPPLQNQHHWDSIIRRINDDANNQPNQETTMLLPDQENSASCRQWPSEGNDASGADSAPPNELQGESTFPPLVMGQEDIAEGEITGEGTQAEGQVSAPGAGCEDPLESEPAAMTGREEGMALESGQCPYTQAHLGGAGAPEVGRGSDAGAWELGQGSGSEALVIGQDSGQQEAEARSKKEHEAMVLERRKKHNAIFFSSGP